MSSRETPTPSAAPPSPSSRADTASSDSEMQGRSPDVVDITGGEETWTATAARSTVDPPSLRTSKTPQLELEARRGKKKSAGRATRAVSGSSSSKNGAVIVGVETDPDTEEKPAPPRAKRAKKSPAPASSTTARTRTPTKTAESPGNDRRGFDLNEFMASFEPTRAVPERSEATASSAATPVQAPSRPEPTVELTEPTSESIMTELRALREEVARLRTLEGQSEHRWGSVPSAPLVTVSSGGGTAPNAKGELPPPDVRFLTCASFPESSKKAKGEYNPPQAHLLAASRMFRGLGLEPGKMKSPMSFVRMLRELECVKFKPTPAVLMALFSGRLGSRGLTIMHFREASEMSCLEDGSTNANFSSDFIPSATLPSSTIDCGSYDGILDGIHGLNALGHDYMRKLTSRLRTFVSKNKSADPSNTHQRVRLTLMYVNKFTGAALAHLQEDDPIWWANFTESLRSIEYHSSAWTMALVNVVTQASEAESRRGRESRVKRDQERPPVITGAIRRLIPINRRGQEPWLRNVAGLPCSGGSRDRCGNTRRVHNWPDNLPSRLQDWVNRTYGTRVANLAENE
ncbi:hypothetical protein PInf_005614 [Phytophthora infestans]|nr:hypothetical protein PInf_005614 [Phytophthora infestans]